ncbi:hypothetical protein KCU71_g16069, partial [Aureobasidium melanogenum]
METQRPHAPYLPSNFDFVAKNNAFTSDQLRDIFLTGQFMAVVVGFYAGNTVSLPVDPRQRMSCPKANPSRVFTPEGTVSWGGSCMSIYPVDSPGGYQMTGRTIPIFDALGWKNGFSPSRPYLFQDFDILTYYRVSEEELDVLLADFRSGRYKFEWEDIEFDMAEHNRLLVDTAKEVESIRAEQAIAQAEMTKAENESLAKWREEKAKNKVDDSTIESMLADPKYTTIDSPVAANVWKIMVEEKQTIKPNQTIAILEAMKLEIAVNAPADQKAAKVERLLVAPGETVNAGAHIALLKFDE